MTRYRPFQTKMSFFHLIILSHLLYIMAQDRYAQKFSENFMMIGCVVRYSQMLKKYYPTPILTFSKRCRIHDVMILLHFSFKHFLSIHIGLLFIVTEYHVQIFINKDNMKKRFEVNDHPLYIEAMVKCQYPDATGHKNLTWRGAD